MKAAYGREQKGNHSNCIVYDIRLGGGCDRQNESFFEKHV